MTCVLYNSPGFSGTLCDVDIDECKSTPCQNGATCADGINSYTCSCLAGFTGTQCETNIDECVSGPCQNGGTCEDEINDFHCICEKEYAGMFCEISKFNVLFVFVFILKFIYLVRFLVIYYQ